MTKNINTLKKAQSSLGAVISSPIPLLDGAGAHFGRMTSVRASYDWTDADLSVLGRVANLMVRCDSLWSDVDSEGLTLVNAKGTEVANPKFGQAVELERLIVGLTSKVALHSISTAGAKRESINGRAKAAKAASETQEDSDLIG